MAFKPIPYEEPAAGFQPIPYEEPASGFQPIPYEASFTPIPYEEPAPAVAAKPAAVPAVDPNIPPVASANSNQIAEVERWFAETQENEKTRTPVRDVLRDVAAIPGEIPKAFSRGVERLEGSVGPLISAVGDYVDTQQRQWNRVFAESPFGQFVGRRKQEKYIKKHGALPEPSIQAGKATAGERISTFGEGIYDWWNEAANTGWEAPDEKIYGGSFIENPSLTRVVGGAAESAPTMIGAMALSAAGHPGAGAALLAGSESAPIYIEAKRAGASESDAFAFALVSGLGTAALERVGLDAVMGKNPLVDEVIQKLGAKWYTGALVNFAVEGSQESLQEIYQNAVAMGWDGDRQLLDGALEAGLSGGLLGAGGSTARSVYSSFMQKQADKAKSMTDAQIDAAVRESMRPENAQIQLVRKDGQPTLAPVPGGDVAATKGQTVQVDVSGQGPANPAMQQRLIELLNQAQPMPPSPAPAMLAAPQDQVPAALPLPDFTANREDNAPRSTTTGAAAPISELPAPRLVPVEGNPFAEEPADGVGAAVSGGVSVDLVTSLYAEAAPGMDMASLSKEIAAAFNGKDVETLRKWTMHGRGFNDATKRVVFKMIGMPVPSNIKGIGEALDRWAGVSVQERTQRDGELRRKKMIKQAESEIKMSGRYAAGINVDVDGSIVDGKAWIDSLWADGYDRVVKLKNGKYGLVNKDGNGWPLKKADLRAYAQAREALDKAQEPAFSVSDKPINETQPSLRSTGETQSGARVIRGYDLPVTFGFRERGERNGLDNIEGERIRVGGAGGPLDLLLKMAKEQPEFKRDPVFVARDRQLVFLGKGGRLAINPQLLGIDPQTLIEGDEVRVDLDELAGAKKLLQRATKAFEGKTRTELEQEATNRGIGDVFNKALASASVPELRQRLIADEFQRLAGELGRAAAEQPRGGRRGYAYETAGAAKGGDASGGLGSAGVPVDDPLYSNLPIEMPELVEFAELLGQGKLPKIREKLGRAIGLFRFQRDNPDSGSIELRADIFSLVQPEDKQRLRGEALEYARKIKELDPSADETKVYRDRYDYLYDQLLAERKKQDPVLARKTLPHEIGHWVDLVPEWLISRGNILGHIAALKGYTKTMLSEKPGSPGPLTDKERAALRRKAEKELKALRGEVREIVEEIVREEPIYKEFPVTPDDVKGLMGLNAREATPELYEWFAKQERATKKQILKAAMQGLVDERAARFGRREQVGTRTTRETVRRTVGGEPITKEQIRKRYRELLKEEVARRRLHELETIKAELEGAIAWWNGTEKMPDYYRKPEEMFADAYSIFINNPQALAKRAPGFFKAMMDYMDARPHVRAIYDRLQEDIRSGAIYRNRVKRLHKAFEEGDASMFERQNAGRKKSATEWIDAVRYSVDAVFGPMEARVRRSGVSADKAGEIGASIENYLYRATGHEYYMGRMHQEVVRPLLENDLQWSDLSELMFHNRVINERHSMANPLGWTPKSSQERLDEMKARIGPQRWAVLEQARSNLWALNGTVRDMIREAGLFTPELLDRIDENLHYATFAVMRDGSTGNPGSIEEMLENAFGTNTGPKIFRQLGTLKKVQDPAAATAMKMLSLMDAARRNVAKTELVDLLRNEFPGEIKAADMRWNGSYREIVVRESDRAGTIVVMRNGKPEGWYVPKVFVSAFERGNTVENQVLMKMLSAPSRAVKNLYTQLNYGFWPVAFSRDVMAYYAKMPRVSNVPFGGPRFWRYFRRALVDSWSSVMGAPNAGALESLSKQDWITVANPMASRGEGEAIDKLMQRYWQDPANLEADRPEVAAVVKAFTKWLELGQVMERAVKRAGRIYLDRNFEDMPEWRKQYEVHNNAGSPNFLRKGALNPQLDFVALFYNPWKESIRSTFRRFKESPATMAWNTAKYAVAPKVMMWLFASGALTVVLKELFGDDGEEFGRDVERMYRYVPEYDKANYTIIPLGWDDREDNKVAYLRLPLAEEMRIPAAMTWKMLNKSGDYQQAINYMGGQLPVGNPILEVLSAWRQYLSGRNPYDWFRGQPLLDDNVAGARDWRGAAAMGKYTWNALGGSIIHRFNLQDYSDDKTKTERFLDLPVISNALGRWVKVSNRGLADKLRQEVSVPLRQDQERSRLDARSALQSGDMDRIEKLKIQDPRAEAYILNNSSDIFKRKAMKPEESMILFAPTVEERTALETELMKYR